MELRYLFIGFITLGLSLGYAYDYKPVEEDVDEALLYKFNFEISSDIDDVEDKMKMTSTQDKEENKCPIPPPDETLEDKILAYNGLSPLELIEPMFSPINCSRRVEAYWYYDICHGFHVKQYHEQKEGSDVQFQEHTLGRWTDDKHLNLDQKLIYDSGYGTHFKTIKINNLYYPYLELEMDNGTLCEINNKPRTTKVRYVCYPSGTNNIVYFKETSACNYKAVILTSLLCVHPAFLARKSKEVPTKCGNACTHVSKPRRLWNLDFDDIEKPEPSGLVFIVQTATGFRFVRPNINKLLEYNSDMLVPDPENIIEYISIKTVKDQLNSVGYGFDIDGYKKLYSFLFSACLLGAANSLRFEFCFNRHVRLLHKDRPKIQVVFGIFNDDLHRHWLKSRPEKRLDLKSIGSEKAMWYHFGVGGNCDMSGDLCKTDAKLVCNPMMSLSSLSMALWEPKHCEFLIVIESGLVCMLMEMVDDDGIITKAVFRKFLYELVEKRLAEVESRKNAGKSATLVDAMEDVPY